MESRRASRVDVCRCSRHLAVAKAKGERVMNAAAAATSHSAEPSPMLITAGEAARMLGVAESTFRQWDRRGACPARVDLPSARIVRWRVRELEAWARHNCPHRTVWAEMLKSGEVAL